MNDFAIRVILLHGEFSAGWSDLLGIGLMNGGAHGMKMSWQLACIELEYKPDIVADVSSSYTV